MDAAGAFVAAVEATVRRHALLRPGEGVVVAVSGGPDSVALLDVLVRLSPGWRLRLVPAHVDHGLRPDSAADAAWLADRVRALGLELRLARVDAAGFARRHGLSPEAAARLLRYRALEEVRRAAGADRLAVGHHRDDLAETVLLRLLTGAGSDGLAGIPPARGSVVRPLIERTRAEIETYLRARGLEWREDPSNRDPRFLRNRVRHELLPWLERAFNPRVREVLARTAALLRDEVACLEEQARQALAEAVLPDPPAVRGGDVLLALDAERVAALPVALQRRVLRQACWRALRRAAERREAPALHPGDPEAEAALAARLPAARIEDLRRLLARPGGVDLAGGLRVLRRGKQVLWLDRGHRVTMN